MSTDRHKFTSRRAKRGNRLENRRGAPKQSTRGPSGDTSIVLGIRLLSETTHGNLWASRGDNPHGGSCVCAELSRPTAKGPDAAAERQGQRPARKASGPGRRRSTVALGWPERRGEEKKPVPQAVGKDPRTAYRSLADRGSETARANGPSISPPTRELRCSAMCDSRAKRGNDTHPKGRDKRSAGSVHE